MAPLAPGDTFRAVNDEAQARARAGLDYRAVFIGFGLSLALAFVGGLFIYFKFVAYGRVAARHLPDDTRLAARIDVETLLISDPIRARLLPLFDQGVTRAELKARHDRFRAHTGVELGRDLREIVLSVSDAGWVLVFGGKFPKSGLVRACKRRSPKSPPRACSKTAYCRFKMAQQLARRRTVRWWWLPTRPGCVPRCVAGRPTSGWGCRPRARAVLHSG